MNYRTNIQNAFDARLEQLKCLIEAFNFEFEEVGVFGSYARGDFTALSDIDICIICKERPDRYTTGAIRDAAEQLKADVVFVTRDYLMSGRDLLSTNIKRDYRRIL